MKILLCHNYYQLPGGEDQVFHDERALLEAYGHDVVTYTRHNDEIRGRSLWRVAADTVWNRQSAQEIQRIIRRHRPDIMHCTNTFPLLSPAIYSAARAEGVGVVQSLHNYRLFCANGYFLNKGSVCDTCLHARLPWRAVRDACYRDSRAASATVAGMQTVHRLLGTWRSAVDQFISCSEFARQQFIAGGIPGDRITVKPNFVQPDTGIGPGRGGYAVFVGRLSPEKGVETLLQAWSQLDRPLQLKVIGDGPLRTGVQQAAAHDARIEWLGWQPLPSVLSILGDAEVLVMPSVWYETFGRVIVEAYSKGTPVIVSRLGAMAELVDHGRTGWQFSPGNPYELAAAVRSLAKEPQARSQMRLACRREFEQKYTAEENYRQLIAIYRRFAKAECKNVGCLQVAATV